MFKKNKGCACIYNISTSERRRYIHLEWMFCFRKVNRRDTQKFEKPTLPSQKQRVKKTKEVQKALKALCDEDDDSDCSDNSSFIIARSEQKVYNKNLHINQASASEINVLEVNLIDSSNENSSASYEQDKQEKNKKCQKTRLVDKQDVSSRKKKDSKLVTNEKSILRRNRISDDSDADSSDISSNKTIKQKYVIKKSKETGSNYANSSDSESESDSINETSIISKNLPKCNITQQKKKKITSSYNMKSTKDKLKKHYDSSNESDEDEDNKKQIKKKNSNRSYNNKEKHENNKKLFKRKFCNMQEDDSDTSSGKEFQKIKIQKVHGDKYSKKQEALVDLEIDNMKSVDSENEKSKENNEEQTILNFNEAKRILKGCKIAHLNFLMYIKSIELCEEKDEEQVIVKSIQEINKLKMTLEKKQKDLITFYQSRFSSSKTRKTAKKLHKIVSDNEQFPEITNIHEKQAVSENEHNSENERESKDVSECDSEKIFSADETKTPQKIPRNKKNILRIEDDMDDINFEVDENEMLMDKLKDNDNNSMDLQDRECSSPVLSISKAKKIRIENIEPIEKPLSPVYVKSNNKETQLANIDSKVEQEKLRIDDDIYEISSENSIKDNNKMTLENLNQNSDYSDIYETLQNEVPNKEDNTSTLLHDEKKNLSNHEEDNQRKMIFASANEETYSSKEIDISKKTFDNIESVNEAEMLAKKALLESDSDTDDTVINTNFAKQNLEEDLIIDTSLKKDAEDNYSDVSSNTSTVILSTLTKSKNNAKIKTKITNEDKEIQLDKKSDKDSSEMSQTSDETNAKKEQNAKKILLESHSEDALSITSLLDSEGTEEKNKLNISRTNADAKKALLASSSESSEIEMNILKKIKNTKNHEINSDENSLIARIKKRKLKLSKNDYYKKDKKLRMSCEVRLERLNEKVLKRYSHVLKKSREYLEQKAFKSLVNLDRLEKRYKKNKNINSDTSTDDEKTSASAKISNKRKGNQITKEESLMDHLKRIENGEVSTIVRTDSSTDESIHQVKDINAMPVSNEALMSEANKIAKDNLLISSDSDTEKDVLDSDENINNDDKNKVEDKKKKKKSGDKTSKQNDDKKEKNDKSNWRQNKVLTMKFSDTDSDTEKKKWDKKQEKIVNELGKNSNSDDETRLMSKKKKIKRRILDSDSDIKLTDCSDSDNISEISKDKQNTSDPDVKREKQKRKKRKRGESNSSSTDSSFQEKKAKPKRKRIKKVASDSDSSDGDMKNSQGSTPAKSGRKNIRKVLKNKQVAEDTKLAAKEEEERLKRIAERQALYNEVYEMRLAGEEKVDKLVLDFDTETKEELISVHKELVKRLKPHQAQGIKFMWDACFESLERVKTTSGSGCIIAHCMGLGKTLQVVALTHTLLTHEATGVRSVLIVCPLSTVLNWLNEYNTWLKDLDDINVYELTKYKKNFERKYQLQNWQQTGGVMIIGYEMFRNLTGPNKNIRKATKEVILECLVDPGADLIVCDEGHLLKNEDTALSKCMRRVKTMRRIVLTGTPLQNNLTEYHCMVQFVKPNLLGTKKEFLNRFVNPITNGQFDDSTAHDVKLMKKRAHVLHKMLEGSVQRFDYSVLTPFLPPKQEYVIFVRLTDIQIKMYQYYLVNLARRHHSGAGGTLFADFQALQRIWTHPIVLRLNAEKIEKANEKKGFSSESEGSLKDFINDDTTSSVNSSTSDSDSDNDVQAIDDIKETQTFVPRRRTRNNPGEEEPEEEFKEEPSEAEWWLQFVQPEHFEDIRVSAKLLLLFGILKECEQIGDKVLVFSQSLYSLTLIEEFLGRIDDETQKNASLDTLDNHTGSWSLGLDYFRLDGQTSAENRSIWCKIFNKPNNTRARLFLISTRAGGLGINLTAANRVIIFDASWNPSHDVQSIFRIYRFGQKKPCYVYRFLAAGTMEEKIYNRQVTKLSLSCRVVDEQQIERHYSNQNLNELYMFESYNDKERPTLNLPKDRLLAEIFLKYKDVVENYHEHDSLLENKAEEELDEEERKQAWLEYEEEKKGKPLINPMVTSAYQNNILLQQYNMMMNTGQPDMVSQGISVQMEYENLQQLIRKDYPNATPEQQKMMTNRALIEMYNYWEKRAALFQSPRNPTTTPTNFQQRATKMSYTVTNSDIHQTPQLNQLLTSGQTGNYANKPVQPNVAQRDLVPNPYRNVPSTNNAGKTDDDIIEVIPTTSNTNTLNAQVAIQSTSKSNNQEE